MESGRYTRKGPRVGVAPVLIAVVVAVIVLVAAASAYFVLTRSSSKTASSSSASTSTPSASSVHSAASSSARSSSTASGVMTYSGTFNFSLPLGPGGERVLSNNTVQEYNSTQFASGSFTFTINPQNYSGSGSGHGTMTVTTIGFCSGKVTVPYAFLIPDATNILHGNITVFFGTPTPSNVTVPLTCTGPMAGVNTATNNPISFLPVYPNEINVAAVPVTVDQHLTGNITYYFRIVQTG